ncbi:hypothetical protein MAR_ORF393 [Marseillevirus marseillevirus]|uniref:Uncharacterized protein n=1 Tax=Marseillevirus marseillevirus TaxID=694581 RepID=D2XB29_GBMV|nr:hypothetical protein MAR_ORF393 [Marseillevirus marseillevirus]YP_009094851.1 hypothetical protein MEL_350 [Melbournevirus]ADB04156.1 hypothetical protein MAR_ORF393 [Marseillevirus marseillevirus]AIT54963.1 hypothetical protein MEL_350 [Melbournevirus]
MLLLDIKKPLDDVFNRMSFHSRFLRNDAYKISEERRGKVHFAELQQRNELANRPFARDFIVQQHIAVPTMQEEALSKRMRIVPFDPKIIPGTNPSCSFDVSLGNATARLVFCPLMPECPSPWKTEPLKEAPSYESSENIAFSRRTSPQQEILQKGKTLQEIARRQMFEERMKKRFLKDQRRKR